MIAAGDGVLVPGLRILACIERLERLDTSVVFSLVDYRFSYSKSVSVRKGHEETAVSRANGQNVYTVSTADQTLCFFGSSEQDVIDRLGVAETMLE